MSKGSTIIAVRIPAELMQKLQAEYLRWADSSLVHSDTSMSDFIRVALEEKIMHRKRSRRSRRKPKRQNERLQQFAEEVHGVKMRIAD